MTEHFFTTFVRTKTVFQTRLKDLKDYNKVKVYVYELKKLGVTGPVLFHLQQLGEIWYDDFGFFKALKDGPVDPDLLKRVRKWPKQTVALTSLHKYMRQQLMYVTVDLEDVSTLPIYFRTFLEFRGTQLDEFFTVDAFSNRVHTPIVSLKHCYRKHLLLKGKRICSVDVKQMQPTILAKILLDVVGKNSFSDSIFMGEDVYLLLLRKNKTLRDRSEAKTFLFRLIFGKPMNDIEEMFHGNTDWVQWINDYKSRPEPRNPHTRDTHTNLAWLLQFSEVQIMSAIWRALMDLNLCFVTIHDDILCSHSDQELVEHTMRNILKQHFKRFELTITKF